MRIVKVLLIISFCFLSVGAQTNPLTPMITENGFINLSLDALGTNSTGGKIQVNKPKNATVRNAYLIAASLGMSSKKLIDGDITIDGMSVKWSSSVSSSISSWNHWADVTSLVKTKIDASAAGLIDFSITEGVTTDIDGEILAVIFDDPNQTNRNTVVLFFGAQNVAGDDFYIRFAEPINLADPNLRLDFSLGISFGYQYGGSQQYSIVDVNGKRLTTSAGGEDDGISGNGGLITVGGIGDVNTNPANPTAIPTTCRDDDELYNLIPFVAQGDTLTHIFTKNPSNDDNILFAALFSSVTSIVGEGILLTPDVDTNFIGTRDTLAAKVQNSLGVPVVGRKVVFEIVSGPHAGKKDSSITNSLGNAFFNYTGVTIGQDEIIARAIASSGDTLSSNLVYHVWQRANINTPPTTNPVSVSNSNRAAPTISWTYSDVDGNPQTQYEVEVWTGANGTGSNFWNPAVGSGIISSVMYAGSPLVNGQTYYARVRAHDGTSWGAWSEVSWIATLNFPPVANAGPDQTIYVTAGCSATAHLDGSGSRDPNGDPITYAWKGPFPGTLSGATQSVDLPVGTNKIELIVTDINSSSDTDSVTVTVRDTIDPVPNLTTLPVIKSLCQVTVTTRPTATDNCSGIITATTTDPLTYTGQDTTHILWIYSDGYGNTSTQLQTVIIHDTAAPVPLNDPLPVLKGECELTVTSFPKAADYCNGTINGTTTDSLTFNKEGIYQIHWSYTDSNGNSSTQLQTVIIHDSTAPAPLVDSLPVLKGECEFSVTTYPKADDHCNGTITGKTSDSLTFKNQGIYQIHWTYTDSNANSSTQLQTVIIHDTTAPVPLVDSLPVLTGECELSVTSNPKADDHCNGTITATTSDPLTYNTQGTHQIHWTYTDSIGNSFTQLQTVIIHDTTAPVPLIGSLPVLKSECALSVTTYPQASDSCTGIITATTADPLTFNKEGTYYINWKYNDGNGNITTQSQTVIIHDNTAPVPLIDSLPVLKGSCSVTASAPFALDNCSGQVMGTTLNPTEYHEQGIHEITWTYTDANGNVSTQKQNVIVKDTIKPLFINKPSDTLVVISALKNTAMVHIDSAKAFDSCSSVIISAVRSDGFDIDSAFDTGTTSINWKACDLNENCDSALQKVTVRCNHIPELAMPVDAIMREGEIDTFVVSASDSDNTMPNILFVNTQPFITLKIDNGKALVIANPGCNDHGLYTLTFQASDGIDSVTSDFKLEVEDIDFPPVFDSIGYQKAVEMQPFNLQVNVRDCDGTVPWIKIINAPSGSNFIDNNNGSGTFSWTPGIASNGYYVIIFETGDGTTTVRDTIVIEVIEKNLCLPELRISNTSLTTSVKLPITILATGSDKDGTPPLLKASSLPTGSHFSSDGNGAGVFTWTPLDTGKYSFTISAIDCFDTTVSVDSTITIHVTNENLTGPSFSPCNDTTIDQNKEMVLTIRASDPDGTIPSLYLISNPPGVSLIDNEDGTAKVVWNPDCDISGKFKISAGAADQSFYDTLDINVTVRDVNCAPVINPIPDISAEPGEPVTIPVSAFDPDNDGTAPILSVNCNIGGFTFVTSGGGSAEFKCLAPSGTGVYPVTFYATDGILTDSLTVRISVNKKGSLEIISRQKDARIYVMPAGCFKGHYLGQDSVTYTARQGSYSFEVQCNGYRSQRFSCAIIADTTKTESVYLKSSIPLIFAAPETLEIDTNTAAPEGSFSFIDLNGDGIEDLVFTKLNKTMCYAGLDKANNKNYKFVNSSFENLLSGFDPLCHLFVDWNNRGFYDCIYSDKSGKVFIVDKNKNSTLLVNRPGEKLFPMVLDIGNDGKKDLLVHSEGHGIFIYRNNGTDSFPAIDYAVECKDTSGNSFTGFKGVPLLADLDNNGSEELIISSDNILKIYSVDSIFSTLTYKEVLNCGGKRLLTDSVYVSTIGSPQGMPKLVIRSNGKMLLYPSHLLGDVNQDSVVDIQDISAIAKNLDISESDPEYKTAHNLMLSNTGKEQIDIRDISKASKCWELQE